MSFSPSKEMFFALWVTKAAEALSSLLTALEKMRRWIRSTTFWLKKKDFFFFNVNNTQCQEIFSTNWCLLKLFICVCLPPRMYQSFFCCCFFNPHDSVEKEWSDFATQVAQADLCGYSLMRERYEKSIPQDCN